MRNVTGVRRPSLEARAGALLCDPQGRPYFSWDSDLTLEEIRERLADKDTAIRAYHLGRLMRQAKPDDVFQFVGEDDIRSLCPHVEPYLGRTRAFWAWLLEAWRPRGDDRV